MGDWTRTAIALWTVAVVGLTTVSLAQTHGATQRFTFGVENASKAGLSGPGRLQLVIDRWSTDAEREGALLAMKENGPDGLAREIRSWSGEVIAYDREAKTLTVKAPYRKHIDRYIGEFTRGDRVMLTWGTPGPGETDAIIYVGRYEAKSLSNFGYVLPVEFVSADTTEHQMTFTVAIPSSAFKILRVVPPGGWITATTPFDQPREPAVITAIERSREPSNPARKAGS